MSVSLKHIAQRVNVSVTTVNQILNGNTARFSDETCRRVKDAAHEVGYRPNMAARGLRQNKSFLIGILFSTTNGPFLADFLRGIMAGLGASDYTPAVFSCKTPVEEAAALERCLHRRVDGLIVNAAIAHDGSCNRDKYRALADRKLPILEVFGNFLNAPSVSVDLKKAAGTAVQYLLEKGHKSIAMITHSESWSTDGATPTPHPDAREMLDGYFDAIADSGNKPIVISRPLATSDQLKFERIGRLAAEELLALRPRPQAVICYNDDIAWGVCQACRDRGIAIPEELAIVGYGDDHTALLSASQLTTLRRPVVEAGQTAAELLLNAISGNNIESIKLTAELIRREST